MEHASPPPFSDADRIDRLQLIRSRRVGPSTFARLLEEYGTAAAAIDALPDIARGAGVDDYRPVARKHAHDEYHTGREMGYRLVCLGEPDYPPLLAGMDGAPPLLWFRGGLALADRRTVAIVGARNASSLGSRFTRHLVRGLGEAGCVVVSGLARGIDAVAHDTALETGTVAVQAGGLDVVYPRENAGLQDRIGAAGLCLSEQPLGLVPQARHFPQRNRIIAGLSLATIVVEGAARSGSLITARDAADLGRDVMAVPGNPFDARAAGCNALIRDGATLVRGAEDVLEVLGSVEATGPGPQPEPQPGPQPDPPPPATGSPSVATGDLNVRILQLLGPSGTPEDALIRDIGLPASAVTPQLTALELEGRITRQPGGLLARTG